MSNVNFFNKLKQIGRENLEAWMQSVNKLVEDTIQEGLSNVTLPDLLTSGIPNSTTTVSAVNYKDLKEFHFYHVVDSFGGPITALNTQSGFMFVICDKDDQDQRSIMQYCISADNGKHYVRAGLLSDLESDNLPWVDIQATLKGDTGVAGKSAYQIWLEAGNVGTVQDYLTDLTGTSGKSSYELWLEAGNSGTVTTYLSSLIGPQGKSAYTLWLELGNTGTVTDFINSLAGQKGDSGESFFDTWLGLPGNSEKTFADLQEELKGEKGDKGDTPNYSLEIGTVTTLPAGSQATAEITGTGELQTINFGIPQGAQGIPGTGGGGGDGVEVINSMSPTDLRGATYWGKNCKGFIFGLDLSTPSPSGQSGDMQFRPYYYNSPASVTYSQMPAVYEINHFSLEVMEGFSYEVQLTKVYGLTDSITPIYRLGIKAPGELEVNYRAWQDSTAFKVPTLKELLTDYANIAFCTALWGTAPKSGVKLRSTYSGPSTYAAYLPSESVWLDYGAYIDSSNSFSSMIYSHSCAKPQGVNFLKTSDTKLLFAFCPTIPAGDLTKKSFKAGVASGRSGHAVVEYYEDFEDTGVPKLLYEYYDADTLSITQVELTITGTFPLVAGINFLEISVEAFYNSVADENTMNFSILLRSADNPSGYPVISASYNPSVDSIPSTITAAFFNLDLGIKEIVCENCLAFAEFPAGYPVEIADTNLYAKLKAMFTHAYGVDYDVVTPNLQFN